jgi:hypothetical protein
VSAAFRWIRIDTFSSHFHLKMVMCNKMEYGMEIKKQSANDVFQRETSPISQWQSCPK